MIHWFRSKSKAYPQFYNDYVQMIKDEGYSDNIISLDMESTSIDVNHAGVLSFGSVLLKQKQILLDSCFHKFYRTESDKLNDTKTIHEITDNQSSIFFDDDLEMILSKISNNTILGHYVQFDISLINKSLKRHSLPKLKNPRIDTLNLSLKKDGVRDLSMVSREDYSLYNLCNRYNIDVYTTHDALYDAYLSALLYLHL